MAFGSLNVPLSTRKPGQRIGIDASGARAGVSAANLNLLLIGYRITGQGTATDKQRYPITNSTQGAALFGAGSELDLMVRAAAAAYRHIPVYAIAQPEPDGVKASQLFTCGGKATAPGQVTVWLGGRAVTVDVAVDAEGPAVAAALKAAIDARPILPVTATVGADPDTDKLTVTYKTQGTSGNLCKVRAESTATGLTIVAGGATLALGTGDMDLTGDAGILAIIKGQEHNYIAASDNGSANIVAIGTQLEELASAMEMRNQQAIFAHTGTIDAGETLAVAVNSAQIQILIEPSNEDLPCELAAAAGAIRCREGGQEKLLPLNYEPIPGRSLPLLPMDDSEVEYCLHHGLTPLVLSGTSLAFCRSITTYLMDDAGNTSDVLLDTLTVDSAFETRRVLKESWRKFARAKVTDDTLRAIRSDTLQSLIGLEKRNIVEMVEEFKDDIVAERDSQVVGRVNVDVPANIVSGLYVLAGILRLRQQLAA